ncbi:hypothetical protein QMK33_15340 [Hymenobacter sp. H14-R3]|uniref:hypothetical protein n=1 Tax=Hymenobacter sp. H14-R3 TaxID=3046308 RepID=UPI0024BAECAF|nr:hypothetical protein [Hymenobacter sp. H14-R3]MDJ0366532.1 hypothetical protein [Hymenobacter sp. H14-R3]
MNKPVRPSFATAAVAEITSTSQASKPVNPDEALWPNAGIIRSSPDAALGNKDAKDNKDEKEIKPEKITFSNKLEAATYLKLQQLATYGGENIQEILEAALTAYFADKEEASRPLPPKVLVTLRRKYPFL